MDVGKEVMTAERIRLDSIAFRVLFLADKVADDGIVLLPCWYPAKAPEGIGATARMVRSRKANMSVVCRQAVSQR